MNTGDAGGVPDFVSLYGVPTSLLSPRLAACLWAAAGVLADTYRGPGGRSILVEDLPPVVARVADDSWYDRFLVCFETLEDRFASGGFDPEMVACCTGEDGPSSHRGHGRDSGRNREPGGFGVDGVAAALAA